MANLPENSAWDAGVYQIETTDLVQGGLSGPANMAAKNLANRTLWLKNQILSMSSAGMNEVVQVTSGNWVCPVGVTKVMILDAVGGGGGGGAAYTSGMYSIGGGGGEGCRVQNVTLTVVPGQSYALTIGPGGAAGTSGNGSTGGTTSFGALLTLPGGDPGKMMATGYKGGRGGTTVFNGIRYAGWNATSNPDAMSLPGNNGATGGGFGGSIVAPDPDPANEQGGIASTAFSGGGGCGGGYTAWLGGSLGTWGVPTTGAAGYIKFVY